jgi:hypothetical protein
VTELATITTRSPVIVVAPGPARKRSTRRGRARRAMVAFVMAYLALSFALARSIEGPLASARDPEYAARRDRLLAMNKANPNRPIVLALGSSRMVEGVRPDAIDDGNGPLWLNGGLVGSGSMMELMSYRRLKRDGLKPTHVLLEYWPPLLRGDNHAEYGRIDLPRLGPGDWPIVRDYFPDPSSVGRYLGEGQLWPVHRYRRALLASIDRSLVPASQRDSKFAKGIDRYGWWPGVRDEDAPTERAKHTDISRSAFRPYLDGFSVGEPADRALRDVLAECRADGVVVTLVFLPESTAFRSLYSAEAEARWRQHRETLLRDEMVSMIDARTWEFNSDLPDGVHLTQGGATRVTKRLHDEWRAIPSRPSTNR